MKKVLWKVATCIAVVLVSFGAYSCGDDDEDSVGSRDLLIGVWNGVYYLEQEWEDGDEISNVKEDFVNGNIRYSTEFKIDGTYVEKEVYVPTGSTQTYRGTWEYSGKKLTMTYTEDEGYVESWTVTKMTDTELVFEFREKEKEDGSTYENYEQFVFKK